MDKNDLCKIIEEKKQEFITINDKIWDYAELSLKEYKSAELYLEALKKEGFDVTENFSGIKTAFCGSYGSTKPVIGILAEFDALSGLSQKPCCETKTPVDSMDTGHGCGHNILGAASFAAACAVKEYIKETGCGTVIFYGCPGEEGGAGKAFMARDGEFKKLDAALTWHPGDTNEVSTGTCNSSIQVEYTFEGVAAHAAGNPEVGRSALDAVELMNIGVQFLREHMPSYARIHYSITNTGGISPNVVQEKATVLYMTRGGKVADTIILQKRVDKIAQAAAMMTETTLKRRFIDGTADEISNETLETLLYKNMCDTPLPEYTAEEEAFAAKIKATYESFDPKEHLKDALGKEISSYVSEKTQGGTKALADFVVPYAHSEVMNMGSTDVGDVSYLTPTAQFNTVTTTFGAPGHSWQNVSMGKTSIAHKGMLTAAKILAKSAVDLIENPEILQQARNEFAEKTQNGYACPIEEGATPQLV